MKAFLIIASLFTFSSHVFSAEFTYQPQLVRADNRGEKCPDLSKITIQDDLNNASVTLTLESEEKSLNVTTNKSYESTHCLSDMVCPTSVVFNQLDNSLISIERNNDGNYPTTNEPGFSTLEVGLYKIENNNLKWTAFCFYTL